VKVKILIIPLVLAIALALVVWLIYPAYLNMNVQKKALENKNLQVSDLTQKEQKVKELMSSLNASAEEQAVVMKFLPGSQKEEEIIASLNDIASQEEVSVSGISVSKPKIEAPPLESIAASIPPAPSLAAVGQTEGDNASQASDSAPPNIAKTIKFQAELDLYGPYEKIKNVINKVYSLDRFNRAVSLEISHSDSESGKENTDNLQANLALEFNYLEMAKMETVADMNNKILTLGKFDMSVVDEIKKNRSTPISSMDINSTGKANPFLP
jgi:hypothetical protein